MCSWALGPEPAEHYVEHREYQERIPHLADSAGHSAFHGPGNQRLQSVPRKGFLYPITHGPGPPVLADFPLLQVLPPPFQLPIVNLFTD
jgi:hypothetical protein